MRYRSLRRVGAPTVEPVSLAEAKAHCRVDIGTDDALIAGYISAARELCEDYLDRSLVTQQYVMRLDQFPPEIELPRPPVVSSGTATAVAVTYTLNDSGATAALATTQYRVDRDSTPGAIRNLYGGTWPSNRDDQNSISVTWWAGYGNPESVPQRVKNAILMTVLELYEKRGDAQLPPGAKALLDSVSWGQYA
ncbi:MAG: hypothetical protein EB117_17385 [Betaproteobacteria bacterium]|nr:hypothetical protein [Betaproteobacteria bacterium]